MSSDPPAATPGESRRLSIALVNSIHAYGGGEKRVLRGAAEFAQRGHAVRVLGQSDGELAGRCRAEGVPFSPITLGRYYSPASITALARELRAAAAEVVVCYDERAVRIGALAARLAGRGVGGGPPVVYYYGLEGSFKNKPYNRVVVAPRITRWVANAAAIRDELAAFGWIPPERMRVIYDGVDPTPIERADPTGVREDLGAAPDDVVALVVARLVPEKGHGFLIQALGEPGRASPGLKVWIAGEGPEAARLEAQIAQLGLGAAVRLLGFRADVPRLLRAVDLLCHPSRREGAPNAVREAMAAGLLVVAVAASGTPELISHGETGFLSPPGDAEGLRRHLAAVVADPDLRSRMGAAGRRRALVEFSEALCAERWLDLLAECVPRGAGG